MTIPSTNITFSSLNTFFGWDLTQYPSSSSSSSFYPGTGGKISSISLPTTSNFKSISDFSLLTTNQSYNYNIGYFKTYPTNFFKYKNISCAGNYYINLNYIGLSNFFSIDISFSTPSTNNSYILQISNNTTLTNKGIVIKYINNNSSNLNFEISWNYDSYPYPPSDQYPIDIGVFTPIMSFSIPQNNNNLYRITLIYDSGTLYINNYTNRNTYSITSPYNNQDSTYLWLNTPPPPSPVAPSSLIYYGIGIYSQSTQIPVNAYVFNDGSGNVALLIYIPPMSIFTNCKVVVAQTTANWGYNFGNIFSSGYTSGYYLLTEQSTSAGNYSTWVASTQAVMIAQSGSGTGGVCNGIVDGNPLEISTFSVDTVLPDGNFIISSYTSYNSPLSRYKFANKTPFQVLVYNNQQYNYNTNALVSFLSPWDWSNINFNNGNGNFDNIKPVVKWVICGTDINGLPSIAYSYDGVIWNQSKNIIQNSDFKSVAYNGQMWIAVGPQNFRIASSIDGINWILNSYNSPNGFGLSVYWNGSLWVIAGSIRDPSTGWYYGSIVTSSDGLNWTKIDTDNYPRNTGLYTVAYNSSNNTWVAAGGSLVVYSTDGITWTITNSSVITDNGIVKITVINSQFVATVMSNQANLIYSTNGITWNIYINTIPREVMSNPYKIILFNNTLVIGGLGAYQTGYSTNQGITWIGSLTSYSALNVINDLATYNSNNVLAVGYYRYNTSGVQYGQILTSIDGINWSTAIITSMRSINGIASNIPL